MKKLLIILFVGGGITSHAQFSASVYDCNTYGPTLVTQAEIDAASYEYFRPCISFEPPNTYNFGQQDLKKVTAASSISVAPGFYAGGFDPGGSMLLNIEKSPFDVAVMNYPNLKGVLRYDRLELGVEIPNDIRIKIDEFLEAGSTGQPGAINPYMEDEILVTADFSPVGNFNYTWYGVPLNNVITRHGFHYVPFDREEGSLPASDAGGNYSDALGTDLLEFIGEEWTETETNYPFRIRFAPPVTGEWNATVKIEADGQVLVSKQFSFYVIPSNKKPPLKVGMRGRYFERDGESFMPVGNALQWPRTKHQWDPQLSELYNPSSFMVEDYIDESYKAFTPPLRTFRVYREQIDKLADGGANFFKLIMAPQGVDIEFEELGNYYKRQNHAFELDDILYKAEERDLLIQWNFQQHFSFTTLTYDINFWDWKPENSVHANWNAVDVGNCYGTQISSVNYAHEFFTDAEAIKKYKQKLRYIISRWGYSTNIALFELMTEVNLWGEVRYHGNNTVEHSYYNSSNQENQGNDVVPYPPETYKEHQENIYNWQKEMIQYMHNELGHSKHLYGVDYAGEIGEHDDSYAIPEVDLVTWNQYDTEIQGGDFNFYLNYSDRWADDDNGKDDYHQLYGKPVFFGETGNAEINHCDNLIETRRSQWKMLFSGLAGAMDWSSSEVQYDNYDVFGDMNVFLNGSVAELDAEGWHPGNVTNDPTEIDYQGGWKIEDAWEKDMVTDDLKGDLMYLRRSDSRIAMGVITNRTYNFSTAPGAADECNVTLGNPSNSAVSISSSSSKKLRLRNMKSKNYQIDYYWAHAPTTKIHTSYDQGPKVKLEYDMEGNDDEYIMLFKAYPKSEGQFRRGQKADIQNPSPEEVIMNIYPNPGRGLFTVAMNQLLEEKVSLEIFDGYGKRVFSGEYPGFQRKAIDLSEQSPGLYYISITSAKDRYTRVYVKQ